MAIDHLFSKEQADLEELKKILDERNLWLERDHEKKWLAATLESGLPLPSKVKNYQSVEVKIGQQAECSTSELEALERAAQSLIPWKKGPFELYGLNIDGEWRSDKKWERLEKQIDSLENHRVLDIGCNNGYFMFRMLAHNPKFVLGIDPVVRTYGQFKFIQHFAQEAKLHYEMLGVEHLKHFKQCFETIFSMGIIYHHRHPMEQLIDIREALTPGGQMILETIGIQGDGPYALFPEDRYAKMKNVWFVPTIQCLENWVRRANFEEIQILPSVPTTPEEQRWTPWCPEGAESLKDFLDPDDPSKTIEGHPAPWRMTIIARKKKGTSKGKKAK